MQEGHHVAQLFANRLDRVIRFLFTHTLEVWTPGFVFGNPLPGECSVLNLGQDLLHRLADVRVDDSRPAGVVPVFGGVAHGVTHVAEAALIEEIHDELQLVQTFEVCDFRLISGVDERFKRHLHQRADAAAQYGLLAEQVALCFFFECGFDHARFEVARGP